VEPVRKTRSLMANSEDWPPHENKLLEIVRLFSAMSQDFHIDICNSANSPNVFASKSQQPIGF
jgi:hypothetical protein